MSELSEGSARELELAQLVTRDIADALALTLDERQARLITSIVLRARRESRVDALGALRGELTRQTHELNQIKLLVERLAPQ